MARRSSNEPVGTLRCAGCGDPVTPGAMAEHQTSCTVWAGDAEAEPDWGCKDCLLVWIGPRGKVCPRCLSHVIVSFW